MSAAVDFITKQIAHGAPNMERASTSHVERVNLTNRMHIRRFLRRGNAFSKKIDHHRAAVSLHVAWYNFCRVHETLRVTPAMEAGLASHVWTVQELVERALGAEPCDAPKAKPLAPPVPLPGEKPVAARQTSTGSWLRVVQGGKGKANDTTPPKPLVPPQPVRVAPAIVDDYEQHWRDMDVKLWKQQEKRLDFLGEDSDDDCPY